MKSGKINVLMCATQPQRFLEQLNFANQLRERTTKYEIYFFVDDFVHSIYRELLENSGFPFLKSSIPQNVTFRSGGSGDKFSVPPAIRAFAAVPFRIFRRSLSSLKSTFIFSTFYERKERTILGQWLVRYDELRNLVNLHRIRILLINGDRHLGYEPVFLKVSKDLRIPSIIIYLVNFADEERIFRKKQFTKKIRPSPFTSSYIKRSQLEFNYLMLKNSFYYSHPIGNALKKLGVLTANPFVMGCGVSDILCLDDRHSKELYVERGVAERKIRVVGDGAYDKLYRAFLKRDQVRDEIVTRFRLRREEKIVIVALPQLAEHNILSWNDHWNEIRFLMDKLNDLTGNVLVSLHPKMDRAAYNFLEKAYSCSIIDEHLSGVLPCADVFVATFSSTVRWSVLCGVNTVIVDFYGLNYRMYDFLTSIQKVSCRSKLPAALKIASERPMEFEHDWEILSRDTVFDGRTIERYINIFEEFC
jgi:hypothetical protein